MKPLRHGLRIAAALAVCLISPRVGAWDPSTTHQAMVDRAIHTGGLHARWMARSRGTLGVFSALRLDPAKLSPAERRLVILALRAAHATSGAAGRGGPGQCPGPGAPRSTQKLCVQGDLWESSALAWLRLGVVAELVPTARAAHHFLDRDDPAALRWSDREISPTAQRNRSMRSNGEPLAGVLTRTNFAGDGASALAWIADPVDLLAPARTLQHLRAASLADLAAEREHHLALALIGAGALLHVLQDLTVPAHARGDATAFFARLSPAAADRGLPLQAFARLEFGRSGPPQRAVALGARQTPATRPDAALPRENLTTLVLGSENVSGLAQRVGQRFFSESSLPSAKQLDPQASADAAAKRMLSDVSAFADVELEGATLSPWPADRGYLRSRTGRALAAFETRPDGKTTLFLDHAVYRDQVLALFPLGVDATIAALDLLFPAFPKHSFDNATNRFEIDADASWQAAQILVLREDASGRRTLLRNVSLTPGRRNRIERVRPQGLADGQRLIVVLDATTLAGATHFTETELSLDTPATPAATSPPPPRATQAEPVRGLLTPPEAPVTPAAPPATTPTPASPSPDPGMTTPPAPAATPPNP